MRYAAANQRAVRTHFKDEGMSKEEVYDSKIAPLMNEIIQICKYNGIGAFATFAIPSDDDPSLACTTSIPDESGQLVPVHSLIRQIVLSNQVKAL